MLSDETKKLNQELKDESSRLTDTNVKSDTCRAVLLIGITQKDYENLQRLAAENTRIKNYGVLVRKVIRDAVRQLDK